VFVELVGVDDKHEAFRIGKNVEDICNAYFQRPMELEFENVMDGILLLRKKRYCGYATESAAKPFKLYVKGLEYKRRDNANFVKGMWEEVLKIMLQEKNPRKAVECANGYLRRIIDGEMDWSEFVITQALTRNVEEYAGMPAHVAVAAKMASRNPNNAPACGDRVEYVVTHNSEKKKVSDRAEEPAYAREQGMEIDAHYYGMKQVVDPLLHLFQHRRSQERV
jgi:DNA polymerase elongation subunit (family B)